MCNNYLPSLLFSNFFHLQTALIKEHDLIKDTFSLGFGLFHLINFPIGLKNNWNQCKLSEHMFMYTPSQCNSLMKTLKCSYYKELSTFVKQHPDNDKQYITLGSECWLHSTVFEVYQPTRAFKWLAVGKIIRVCVSAYFFHEIISMKFQNLPHMKNPIPTVTILDLHHHTGATTL